MLIAQLCFPFRRQHAGIPASELCPKISNGANIGSINATNNSMGRGLRNALIRAWLLAYEQSVLRW